MDWWTELRLAVMVFLDRHGLLAACVGLLIEEAGVPLPFAPGDLVMMFLGVRARQGVIPLWQVIVALEGATLAGSSLLYVIARRAGRTLLHRYGRVLHLTPTRLARAETWLRHHGMLAIVVARLVPGFRIAAAVGCGVLGIPFLVFFPGMAAGALVSILLFVLLGYVLGPPALAIGERVHLPLELLTSGLTLALVAVWLARARRALHSDPVARAEAARPAGRARRVRAGLAAGAVATLTSTVLMNVLVHLGGSLAFFAPGTLVATAARWGPLVVARRAEPLLLLAAVLVFVSVGLGWGAVYGDRVEWYLRRLPLPDWARGMTFTMAPLAIALLLVLPVLGLGFPGSDAQVIATVGETIRHLVYGLVLGLTFPIFLTRHLGRAATAHGHSPAPHASRTQSAVLSS